MGVSIDEQQFTIGEKEFEDSFSDEIIHESWKSYVEKCGRTIGPNWTISNIADKRANCVTDPKLKFSDELRSLNARCAKKFTKPIFGRALGDYCDKTNIPTKISELLTNLRGEDNG